MTVKKVTQNRKYNTKNFFLNEQHGLHQNTGGEYMCSRRVSSFYFFLDTRHLDHIVQ
jgi:hypothetical protein